jgi:hypothetical protein
MGAAEQGAVTRLESVTHRNVVATVGLGKLRVTFDPPEAELKALTLLVTDA